MTATQVWKKILPICLVATAVHFLFANWVYLIRQDAFPPTWLGIWERWDTVHFIGIAKNWYETAGVQANHIVFFPLYPLLIRVVAAVGFSHMAAALLVANLFYFITCYYLYRLVALDGDDEKAVSAVLFMSLFPTAYFFHVGYSDSLFLALSVACFYYARTGQWWLVGLAGFFASLTRVVALVILLPLLIEYAQCVKTNGKKVDVHILWLLLPVLGVGLYLVLNWQLFGNPFYYITAQRQGWGKFMTWPWHGMRSTFDGFYYRKPADMMMTSLSELVACGVTFLAVLGAVKTQRKSYGVYMVVMWLFLASNSFYAGWPRYALGLFPVFILMPTFFTSASARAVVFFICGALQATFLSQFIMWRWAF